MDELLGKIAKAQTDNKAMEELLKEYLPFIQKQVNGIEIIGIEYEDKMSVAMLSFVTAVKCYHSEKGNFISFAAVCIRNRLYDLFRQEVKHHGKVISFESKEELELTQDQQAVLTYQKEVEQKALHMEIEAYERELEGFGLSIPKLAKICPKQTGTRNICIQSADIIINNSQYKKAFQEKGTVPGTDIAKQCNVSVKTIEKHRKYIVALVILYLGDFPCIQTFLPMGRHSANRKEADKH